MKKIGSALRDRSEWEHLIDPFSRDQKGLKMEALFPKKNDGVCDCGCGKKLSGQQTRWAKDIHGTYCYDLFCIIRGNQATMRKILWKRDKGFCMSCGVECSRYEWHADHIIPVFKGGGAIGISNMQTLCIPCHKEKTRIDLTT